MKDKRVRDVMQRDVFSAPEEMTVRDFVAECVRRKITGAPVVNRAEEVVGVLSLSDVAAALAFPKPEDTGRVAALMTRPPVTISASGSLQKANELFRRHRIHRLVVTYRDRVLGVVSPVDLLEALQENAHNLTF